MITAPWLCKIKGQCPPHPQNLEHQQNLMRSSLTHFLNISRKLTFLGYFENKGKCWLSHDLVG